MKQQFVVIQKNPSNWDSRLTKIAGLKTHLLSKRPPPPEIASPYIFEGHTRWCSCTRHWATIRNVAGSITDVFPGISHWINPSGHTIALMSTHALKEVSTGNISWGEGKCGRWLRLTSLAPLCEDCLEIIGASTSWSPKELSEPVMGQLCLSLPIFT